MMLPNSGENGKEIFARLKRDFVPTMISGVMYWPLCDFITFKFIPVQLQVCIRPQLHVYENNCLN